MVNAAVRVLNVVAWVAFVMGHVSVHVADLAPVEGGKVLFVLGLLDQEIVQQRCLVMNMVVMQIIMEQFRVFMVVIVGVRCRIERVMDFVPR